MPAKSLQMSASKQHPKFSLDARTRIDSLLIPRRTHRCIAAQMQARWKRWADAPTLMSGVEERRAFAGACGRATLPCPSTMSLLSICRKAGQDCGKSGRPIVRRVGLSIAASTHVYTRFTTSGAQAACFLQISGALGGGILDLGFQNSVRSNKVVNNREWHCPASALTQGMSWREMRRQGGRLKKKVLCGERYGAESCMAHILCTSRR